jgi:ketosteroid isomerase-like protein
MGLTSTDRESIRTLAEDRWVSALLARDVDALASMCAPSLVYMAADQPAIRGIEEFRAWVVQFPAISAFTQPVESIEGNGNVAIARARFTATLDASGASIPVTGKALCELVKDDNGQWLVKSVCWNWDRPLPTV